MCQGRNPLFCVIPPYMLEKLIELGPPEARALALRELRHSMSVRFERALLQMQPPAVRPTLGAGIDAHSAAKIRKVHDAKGKDQLPGALVRSEGDPPTGDPAVDEAYDGTGAAFDMYWEEYKRNSIDDGGMILVSTVHVGEFDFGNQQWVRVNNAFWNGEQMIYGDGDGMIFDRFTIDIDITAHELTHGVTQHTSALKYQFQPGALNEHFSDVFGILCKQRVLGQEAKDANWLIGENVLKGGQYALRSMKAPGTAYVNHPQLGTDPQPATMDKFINMPIQNDNGGVHYNSGIPNHAFYLTAVEIGGKAWLKAGLIWYRTLAERKIPAGCSFVQCAQATIAVAKDEFGAGSLEEKAVRNAWKAVKVL